jgi:hypothetical protein
VHSIFERNNAKIRQQTLDGVKKKKKQNGQNMANKTFDEERAVANTRELLNAESID